MATQPIQYTAPARGNRAKNLATTFATGQQQAGAFAKSLSQAQERRTKEREKLQQVVNEANQEGDVSKRIADFAGTANKSLDQQIIDQITTEGNNLAKMHMQAYGPDGSPKEIAEYNMYKTKLNKHLDDLTLFVGTLEAENKAYEQAIADDSFITPQNEKGDYEIGDTEKFKRNMFKNNNTNLTYDNELGFVVNDGGTAVSVNLTEYGNDLKKNGPGYQAISKNAQPAMDQYMVNLIKENPGLIQMGGLITEEVEIIDPNDPTKKVKVPAKLSFTQQDKDKLRTYLQNQFKNGIKPIALNGKNIQLPPENQMWALLRNTGYLDEALVNKKSSIKDMNGKLDYASKDPNVIDKIVSEDVSWENYNNPRKYDVLTSAFIEYIIGESPTRTNVKGNANPAPI